MLPIIIALAVCLVVVVIILAIMFYHQMLLVNEVNKRLLMLHEDSIDSERNTMDALNQRLEDERLRLSEKFDENNNQNLTGEDADDDSAFNPHQALEDLE